MKKFIALFLVFSIISLYTGLYAKERHGADIMVQRIDGQQVSGELIAVRVDSLLLRESALWADVTVDVEDIKVITIVKESKKVLGMLIGGGSGALIAAVAYKESEEMFSFYPTKGQMVVGAAIFGILVGWATAVGAGKDKTIQIEGRSDSEIKKILEDLRKKARVPNFQ